MWYTLFPTALGDCGIAWCDDRILATQLPEENPAATAARLSERTAAAPGEAHGPIADAIAAVCALLEGQRRDLSGIVCDFSGVDDFAARVYAATRAIPPGRTTTYGAIAAQLGDKQLAQQVGRVLGLNPLPIIVPCHRVLGAAGKLTGFSAYGGIDTKLRMLAIEGARIGDEPDLFDDPPVPPDPGA